MGWGAAAKGLRQLWLICCFPFDLSSKAPSLSLIQSHPVAFEWLQRQAGEGLPSAGPCWGAPSPQKGLQQGQLLSDHLVLGYKLGHTGEFLAPSTSLWGFTAGKCLDVYSRYTKYGSKPKVMEGFTASRGKADKSCAVDLKTPDFWWVLCSFPLTDSYFQQSDRSWICSPRR